MSDKVSLPAYLEERVSSRTGRTYKVVVLQLTNNVEKLVFLSSAELALIELNS